MRYIFTVFICKIFIFVLKLSGKKATSAPGKLAFRLYPDILRCFEKKVKKEIIAVILAFIGILLLVIKPEIVIFAL